jgi:hypothetical protein
MLDRDLGSQWEGEAITDKGEKIDEGKRLFLSLSSFVIILFSLSMAFIWYLIKPRLLEISPYLLFITGIAINLFVFYIIFKIFFAVLSALTEKNILSFLTINSPRLIHLIYLSSTKIGNIFGISKDHIGNSFIHFNNSLVRAFNKKNERERLLVLLPRCIQYSGCKQKVTENINNCRDCGRCPITEFKSLHKKYRFHVSIATGGSLARNMIYRVQPTTILAVACERELVSGIQETSHVRALAIPNWRPEGPCKNTKVDMSKVGEAIRFIYNHNEDIMLKDDITEVNIEAETQT